MVKVLEKFAFWVIFSFLPGCIPIGVRALVYSLHINKSKISLLDPIDLLTLGIALNIQSLHELNKSNINIPKIWNSFFIFLNGFILLSFGVLYTIHLLDKSVSTSVFIDNFLFNYTLGLAILSIIVSLITHFLPINQQASNSSNP